MKVLRNPLPPSSSPASNSDAPPAAATQQYPKKAQQRSRERTPHPQQPLEMSTDDVAASILSEAQRSAASELRSTSEILRLAGSVLPRDRGGAVGIDSMGGGVVLGVGSGLPGAAFTLSDAALPGSAADATSSVSMPLSLSSIPSAVVSDTFSIGQILSDYASDDDTNDGASSEYAHLPGKLGSVHVSLSLSATASQDADAPRFLSRLDGLGEGCTTPRRMSVGGGGSFGGGGSRRFPLSPTASRSQRPRRLLHLSHSLPADPHETARLPQASYFEMMPAWLQRKVAAEGGDGGAGGSLASRDPPSQPWCDYQYEVHQSETVVSHEFHRGDWTWTTEWSPDGKYLALATENHDLAVVDAGHDYPLWKVVHDGRVGRLKNDTTHTIRAIAWGSNFLAIGGTGDTVSIIEHTRSRGNDGGGGGGGGSKDSFRVVDLITETGFAGALDWQKNGNVLAIGNREDQCLIVLVERSPKDGKVNSTILHNIERTDWVNAVAFSPGGTKLAIGDRSGAVSVYLFVVVERGEAPVLSLVRDLEMEDNVMCIQWSPDAKLLYAGGEDYSVSVIGTSKWDIVFKIGRDRWVPFLAPSRGGTHVAAGGANSHVSILDVKNQWKEATRLHLAEDGTPLSANWHPKDQFLAVSGQCPDVVVYETTRRRLVEGKCLRSKSAVLAVEFSPNGKILAVANEGGVVTFFDAQGSSLSTLYETVVGGGGDASIRWSPSGRNVAVTSGSTFVLLDTLHPQSVSSSESGKKGSQQHPPSSSRFLVTKVIQGGIDFVSLAFSPKSNLLAVTDGRTRILDVRRGCVVSRELDHPDVLSSGWSPDGSVFAVVGKRDSLFIYDAKHASARDWELLFAMSCGKTVLTLCWGPSATLGLQYLAFGGEDQRVTILEVRRYERTWETVLHIPTDADVNDLDWNDRGMLAVGDDDGTVSIIDLSYLKSGRAVSEMNYNWQRQAIICTTKLSRNPGRNGITSLRWLQSTLVRNHRNLLAVGGSDGVVEIVDLSERSKLDVSS